MKAEILWVDSDDIIQGYKVGDIIDVQMDDLTKLYVDNTKWCFVREQLEFKENTDTIVETVINKFKQRSEAGIKKYNTTLDRNDLSTLEWLSHLQEELMDATLYIERLKKEYDNERKDTN